MLLALVLTCALSGVAVAGQAYGIGSRSPRDQLRTAAATPAPRPAVKPLVKGPNSAGSRSLRGGTSAATPTRKALVKGMTLTGSVYDLDSVLDRELDLIRSTGSTWIRVDVDWSVTEAERGHYNWFFLDRLLAHASARNLQILGVIDNAPAWARPAGTSLHGEPLDPQAFARFAADAAARYYPAGVSHWEIWNEPNIVDFWEPAPSAERYATLLSATAAAIHAVAPGATVLSGGLSPSADGRDPLRIEPHTFLQTLYDRGAMRQVAAVATHPYTFPSGPMNPTSAFAQLPQVRAQARSGGTERDVWVTEFGAPTGTGPVAVSEAAQAQMLTDACSTARTQSWMGPVFIYQLQDLGDDAADIFQNFGLLRHDGSDKPSFTAWRNC